MVRFDVQLQLLPLFEAQVLKKKKNQFREINIYQLTFYLFLKDRRFQKRFLQFASRQFIRLICKKSSRESQFSQNTPSTK